MRRSLRPFVITFALLLALNLWWMLAIPRNGGPDEASHFRKAAATARGTLVGPQAAGFVPNVKAVKVPAALDLTGESRFRPCFAGLEHRNVDAGCQQPPTGTGLTEQPTTAAKYPPLPYVFPGLVSLATSGYRLQYLMRFAHAIVVAAIEAWAILVVARGRRTPLARAGALLALTPTAVFLGGVLNPNGFENAAGLLAWAGGLALATGGDERRDRRALAALVAGSVLLSLARPLSSLWTAAILVSVVWLAGGERARQLARRRSVRRGLVAIGASVLLAIAWFFGAGLTSSADADVARTDAYASIARSVAGRLSLFYRQAVGQFGWEEVFAPSVTMLAWTLGLGALVAISVLAGRRRYPLAIAGVLAVCIAFPTVIDLRQARVSGLIWQGRYFLALAAGIPLVAGWAVEADRVPSFGTQRVTRLLGWLFVAGHVGGFVWALRRYMVGMDGSVWFWRGNGWKPPVPALALVVVASATLALLARWVLGTGRLTLSAALGSVDDDG